MKKVFAAFALVGLVITTQINFNNKSSIQEKCVCPITISLNGADNVGKTTQMHLLPLDGSIEQRTSIHCYSPFLEDLMNTKEFDNWWWQSSDKEFVTAIFNALKKRFEKGKTFTKVIMFDRGTQMFDAVCVARIAQKNNISLEEAEEKYLKIKSMIVAPSNEQFSILLMHGKSLEKSIAISLEREKRNPDQTYIKYQTLLQKYMVKQTKRGLYNVVIQCDSLSPAQVQNKIREAIRSKFPHLKTFTPFFSLPKGNNHIVLHTDYLLDHKLSLPRHENIDEAYKLLHQLNKFLHAHYWISSFALCGISEELHNKLNFILGYNVLVTNKGVEKEKVFPKIIAFGGLSESGKSTFASMTCAKYKGKSVRLKIDYLLMNPSVYKQGAFEQATVLADHLQRFAKFHPWVNLITIESLHHAESTKALKHVVGDDLIIVYLDTSQDLRDQRSSESLKLILEKDRIKKSRGAHLIQSFADIVYTNRKNNLAHSFEDFFQILCQKMNSHVTSSYQPTKRDGKASRGKRGGSNQWLSENFVLSAGAVVLNQAQSKVCLIQNTKGEYFLPKGRKNVGESLEEAALREAYEETGFRCRLLPMAMPSRATPVTDSKRHIPDVVRVFERATEPAAISMRPGPDGNQKIIFWFIAVAEGTYEQDTQMENEKFRVNFYTFEDALKKLTFSTDKELTKAVIKLVKSSKK